MHLGRPRRHRRRDERLLRARHALPLALRAPGRGHGSVAPLLRPVEHFKAAFYLRNGTANGLPRDAVSIARERFVGTGLQERLALRNECPEPLELRVALEAESDFADIISVKHHDFSLGDPEHALPLPPPAPATLRRGAPPAVHRRSPRRPGHDARLLEARRLDGNAMTFELTLEPHERWELSVDVRPWLDEELDIFEHLDEERESAGDVAAAWTLRVPRVRGGWENLRRSFDRSIGDLAALRMRTGEYRRPLFAAGMPWFMTVFGRDTEITSLQTLLLGPEIAHRRARGADRAAGARGGSDDRRRARARSSTRCARGGCAETWFPRYYGSIDSTPLYLVLLAETWRWTDDASFAQRCASRRCSLSSGSTATATATATASSSTAGRSTAASRISRGRTPATRSASRTDRSPRRRSRPSRCRATSTTRSAGSPSSPARCGASRHLPSGSSARRTPCAPLRRGVLGRRARRLLRARARREEAASRLAQLEHGHLLWSGIVAAGARRAVVDQLHREELWTGWGIRTMASDAAAFNPISYHNGTVWPHDTALAAWGLARHGYSPRRDGSPARSSRRPPTSTGRSPRSSRVRARRDAVPDRIPDRSATAGLGSRHADPPRPLSSGSSPIASASGSSRRSRRRAPELARGVTHRGSSGIWSDVDRRGRGRPCHDCRGCVDADRASSVPSGSRFRRRRTVGRSGSSRSWPTDSSTRVTKSPSSPRATPSPALASSPSSTPPPAMDRPHVLGDAARRSRVPQRPHEFDVLHDHTGMLGLPRSAGSSTRRSCPPCTGPSTEQPGRMYEQVLRLAPTAKLISISMNQRRPKRTSP